jgi:hypothetical protein
MLQLLLHDPRQRNDLHTSEDTRQTGQMKRYNQQIEHERRARRLGNGSRECEFSVALLDRQ